MNTNTKKTGTFKGKSNKLGQGGRAAQLKAKGVPGYVIGKIAREKQAAPGQKNFHRSAKRMKEDSKADKELDKKSDIKEGSKADKRTAKRTATKKRGLGTALGNVAAKVTGWPGGVNDVQLNKKGTVGTEPISKGSNKYTEVKAGPLGKFDIPMGKLRKVPQRTTNKSMTGDKLLGKAMRSGKKK